MPFSAQWQKFPNSWITWGATVYLTKSPSLKTLLLSPQRKPSSLAVEFLQLNREHSICCHSQCEVKHSPLSPRQGIQTLALVLVTALGMGGSRHSHSRAAHWVSKLWWVDCAPEPWIMGWAVTSFPFAGCRYYVSNYVLSSLEFGQQPYINICY